MDAQKAAEVTKALLSDPVVRCVGWRVALLLCGGNEREIERERD